MKATIHLTLARLTQSLIASEPPIIERGLDADPARGSDAGFIRDLDGNKHVII